MKALISPNEGNVVSWVSSWGDEPIPSPVYTQIEGCARVAEVATEAFEVAEPLFWVDCPEECVADRWYFKDGQVLPRPEDVPQPETK